MRLLCGYRGVVSNGYTHFVGTRLEAVDAEDRVALLGKIGEFLDSRVPAH